MPGGWAWWATPPRCRGSVLVSAATGETGRDACRRPADRTHVPTKDFCSHFEAATRVEPPLEVCPTCVETGATWVHLRQCLACGVTACCDASPNRHATAHHRATGHPLIRTAQPDEDWRWCYADDRLYLAGPAGYETTGD